MGNFLGVQFMVHPNIAVDDIIYTIDSISKTTVVISWVHDSHRNNSNTFPHI